MDSRIKIYNDVTHELIYLNDKELLDLTLKKSNELKWGETGVCTLKKSKHKVFFKKIPIAQLYYQNQFDTSNLYKLPAYYNYGFGSAGINPWRELLMHINVTNWVLTLQCENFPLMYHYRIIADHEKNFQSGDDPKLMERYGNDPNIIKYLKDRYNCEYKIVLFLEFIPHVLYNYVEANLNFITNAVKQINWILEFLEKKQIIHTDAHFGNYLVDSNETVYITDFGLLLDKNFNLDKNEIKFYKYNFKLPFYYLAAEIFDNFMYSASNNPKLEDFLNNLKNETNKSGDKINYVIALIKSVESINKIIKFPQFYIDYITSNKNKIIKKKLLKFNLEKFTDKNKVKLNKLNKIN